MTLLPYLALTFAISFGGFACIYLIPQARSPESAIGLPFWLLMVWGPSLAAMMLASYQGHLGELLLRTVQVSDVPLMVWGLVSAPLILLLLMRPFAQEAAMPLTPGIIAVMVLFNLILGPLGEEFGWRGYMQAHLNQHMGWLAASLLVGVAWCVWHLPLWAIDSPHAQIYFGYFAVHVMLYSVIIGAAYTLSGGALLPAILIHLTVNLAANLAVFAGYRDPDDWFRASIPPYLILALIAVLLVYLRTGQIGLRWILP